VAWLCRRRATCRPRTVSSSLTISRLTALILTLYISLVQACILLLFNDAELLSFRDILAATGIPPAELKRNLQSLACVKVPSYEPPLLSCTWSRVSGSGLLPPRAIPGSGSSMVTPLSVSSWKGLRIHLLPAPS